jgi:hypothetical protein
MPDFPIANQISIRDAGFDEYWLQDQIYDNPPHLGLGDLEPLAKEKRQSSGGRLDILLKNPEDDSMYEVEVMLGETDETHIIRTIEYWDNEKRKYPLRQHYAVLVAEHINRRYFNVIHLLSQSIPIIAVQASLLECNGVRSLYFNTILDTYEEIDDGSSQDDVQYNRDYWLKKSKWTVETADALFAIATNIFAEPQLSYVKSYVAINVSGYNYLWLHKRSQSKSLLGFRMSVALQDDAAALLDEHNITYVRKPKRFLLTVDKQLVDSNPDVFRSIASMVKATWEG